MSQCSGTGCDHSSHKTDTSDPDLTKILPHKEKNWTPPKRSLLNSRLEKKLVKLVAQADRAISDPTQGKR